MPEVRTKRLVIADEAGVERASLALSGDVIELRLGGSRANLPCEVLLFVSEDEPGAYAAGIELWAHGNSIRSTVVTVAGHHVELHHADEQ